MRPSHLRYAIQVTDDNIMTIMTIILLWQFGALSEGHGNRQTTNSHSRKLCFASPVAMVL